MGTLREETKGELLSTPCWRWIRPRRASAGTTRHHLVPFSEFFPVPQFVREWLRLMNLPYSDFTRGAADQKPLQVAGQQVAASVCYEDAYGSSQLAALRSSHAARERDQRCVVRQIERALPAPADLAHARHGGRRGRWCAPPTTVFRPSSMSTARVIATAPEYEANVMRATVQPRTGLTPYLRTGNWPIVCLALVLSLGSAYLGRRRNSN